MTPGATCTGGATGFHDTRQTLGHGPIFGQPNPTATAANGIVWEWHLPCFETGVSGCFGIAGLRPDLHLRQQRTTSNRGWGWWRPDGNWELAKCWQPMDWCWEDFSNHRSRTWDPEATECFSPIRSGAYRPPPNQSTGSNNKGGQSSQPWQH